MYSGLRLGVRAIIVHAERLLLVNAYPPGAGPELWCAPGGGVEAHCSLHDNLKREVYEETGLGIEVGERCASEAILPGANCVQPAAIGRLRFFGIVGEISEISGVCSGLSFSLSPLLLARCA